MPTCALPVSACARALSQVSMEKRATITTPLAKTYARYACARIGCGAARYLPRTLLE